MADINTETSKKSGFSFRKKRSNSKTRKDDDQKPVDVETEEVVNEPEVSRSAEHSQGTATNEPINKSPEVGTGETVETVSSGEDASPKGVKSDASSPEGEAVTKKKAKRRSRSLFRRNGKNKEGKSAAKTDEACENLATKGDGDVEGSHEATEASSATNDTNEQVVCDEEQQSEIRAQSDTCGEASETDGEATGYETAEETTGDAKKGEQKNGTKKKGFFKRGLSLRRSKAKKKRNGSESNDEKPASKEVEISDVEMSTASKPESSSLATAASTEAEESDVCAIEKKVPAKPSRKVSFAEPHYEDSEGDSLNEVVVENGDDSQDATAYSTCDEAPSVMPSVDTEVIVEEAFDSEVSPTTVVDDDELTEVSSVASSDVTTQIDAEESEPFTLADTEETGSRITLVESDEIVEGPGDEEESRPEEDASEETGSGITLVESGEIGEGSGSKADEEESRPEEDASEGEKLLEDSTTPKKEGEWTVLQQQTNDVSVELQRVRKQTLFSVKRLCCSVM